MTAPTYDSLDAKALYAGMLCLANSTTFRSLTGTSDQAGALTRIISASETSGETLPTMPYALLEIEEPAQDEEVGLGVFRHSGTLRILIYRADESSETTAEDVRRGLNLGAICSEIRALFGTSSSYPIGGTCRLVGVWRADETGARANQTVAEISLAWRTWK